MMYSIPSMLRRLPGTFLQRVWHYPILRYTLNTYYGCFQSSYISTLSLFSKSTRCIAHTRYLHSMHLALPGSSLCSRHSLRVLLFILHLKQ
ncbi:uncharacterized protein LOC122576782 isoform X3 [Bombus pyrosoma]|uniref:uncharacterized protein LOC122576782 isoform X3 n=1 Tax=Bombus pyrosoma TaxID=396416 RepID=UPI001CB8F1AA|nr:uncharacterized protein LOC122576782 isoform X3 [Bombus pyrosoma]